MFNVAIDSKLRGCDAVGLKVEDVAPHGHAVDRATARQKKTGQPVRFEMTKQTREAVDSYIEAANKNQTIPLRRPSRSGSTYNDATVRPTGRQWIAGIGLKPSFFGTHSLRRIESTVRYLGIEVDDALAIAEQIDV